MNIRLSFVCFCLVANLAALRDPFLRADCQHTYSYIAFGEVRESECFGLLVIDGVSYHVKQGDTVVGHTINLLTQDEVIIHDDRGKRIVVYLKKKPFNLDKLKG